MKAPRKIAHVLFDEFHSESWTVSEARAREMQPEDPFDSSYQIAANALADRDFVVQRNLDRPIDREVLSNSHILVFLHPCDREWESTTSAYSPKLSSKEIADIQDFVRNGGGLVLISEYEHEKYGNNLNELLKEFGLQFENATVVDRSACVNQNPTWIFGESTQNGEGLSHLVRQACFYRAGSCKAAEGAALAWISSAQAHPANAGLIGMARVGLGRVVAVADSSLFGDRHIHEYDHLQLWLNLMYWCSAPSFGRTEITVASSPQSQSKDWIFLKQSVNALRGLQNSDGSVDPSHQKDAAQNVRSMLGAIQELRGLFPHQAKYLEQLSEDLQIWEQEGFHKPDFGKSLAMFNPELDRRNGLENLVVFPMYTPNASKDTRFEAMIMRVPWPDWLAELERTIYRNDKFVPGHLVDFTEGYQSECAVLFPETVSVLKRPTNNFGVIFCDREARRLQMHSLRAAEIVHLELHPQLESFLNSLSLMQETLALWDLIHDKSHSVGELPFDPFMIRQKAPFWMYGLEELRVDLRSFCEAVRLAKADFPFARYVTYAILLDRIFRFPITGPRVRNYDALGGQLLFTFLHRQDVLVWSDNHLTVRWELLPNAVDELRQKILDLYKLGSECSKLAFWIAAHDLVSSYVKPNVASKWKKELRVFDDESDPKKWIEIVHPDEFPLGNFHNHLLARMSALHGFRLSAA